ncbi:MAG: dihydroorotate oxidase [bacterium]|nr:dihydroorotate oxidase [bacterium]
MLTPFYDPGKTYEDNFNQGPFGIFADKKVFVDKGEPQYNFLGFKVNSPFGIPAGPLLNGKFVKGALDKGFDIPIYKTVRSGKYPCHPWPNVLAVKMDGDLTLEKMKDGVVVDKENKGTPELITNSFGVPSFDPEFWQKDLADVVRYTKYGQVVVGSFQGTSWEKGNAEAYIADFALCAKLMKETSVKAMEVNLSCPNEGSAHLLCFDIERTKKILEAIKKEIGEIPLIAKIAYFPDEEALKNLIKETSPFVQAYSSINTLPAKVLDDAGNQALLGEGRAVSGLCGHAIKWAGLEMVKKLKKLREELNLSYTIIGVGGVTNPDDFLEYRNAGADFVMSATGAMWNPLLAKEIKEKLG